MSVCLLGLWLHALVGGSARGESVVFPADAGVHDVTKAPFGAKGDGRTDDTAAIQAALDRRGLIYLPDGTYLVSRGLRWAGKWNRTVLQGQSREGTVILLKGNAEGFQDAEKPGAVVWTGETPAQRFRNGIRNLTVDTGTGNPGAIGIRFYGSNQAGMHRVGIRDGDGRALTGLDMGYSGDNGPLLASDIEVRGFNWGVRTSGGQSVTIDRLRLEGQREAGFLNKGQRVFLRRFESTNAVPALRSSGMMVLLGGDLKGGAGGAAIVNEGGMFARDVKTGGYAVAIADGKSGKAVPGTEVGEWSSHAVASSFPSTGGSLDLPVKEVPEMPWDAADGWVSVRDFPPVMTTVKDAKGKAVEVEDWTGSVQQAIDSGKGTVYFPKGKYFVAGEIRVRGKVRRIFGTESEFEKPVGGKRPVFIVEDGAAPVVVIERFDFLYADVRFEHRGRRSLVLSSMAFESIECARGAGDLFLEDMVGNFLDIHGGNVWARQLNMEHSYGEDEAEPRPNVRNMGGMFWLFGLKTEQNRTKVVTTDGGSSEIYAYILANRAANPQPMFVSRDSRISVSVSEAVLRKAPFDTIVRETRDGVEKDYRFLDAANMGGGALVPMYSGAR